MIRLEPRSRAAIEARSIGLPRDKVEVRMIIVTPKYSPDSARLTDGRAAGTVAANEKGGLIFAYAA